MNPLKKNGGWKVWLFLVLLLSLAINFWGIASESLWLDESVSVKQAQASYRDLLEMAKKDVHPPLHVSILHAWIKIFGVSELAVRSLSAITGALSVLAIFLLAKTLFSTRTALISSLLLSLSPFAVYYSQEARMYSLFLLLSILSFLFFAKYCFEKNRSSLLPYTIFSVLMVYTHFFSFLVLLVQNAYMLYKSNFRIKALYEWISSQAIIGLLFIPWLIILLGKSRGVDGVSWIPTPGIEMAKAFILAFFSSYNSFIVFALLLISIIAAKKFKDFEKERIFFLASWLFLPFITIILYSIFIFPVYQERYMIFVLPAILIVFSSLLTRVYLSNKKIFYFALVITAILTAIPLVEQATTRQKDDWRSIAGYLQENFSGGEYIFVDPFYNLDVFSYYYARECFHEFYADPCAYERYDVLTLTWQEECCDDDTVLTATHGGNTLARFKNETIWVISARPEEHHEDISLIDYFMEFKELAIVEEFIGGISVYKFE